MWTIRIAGKFVGYEKEENNPHLYTYTELLNVIQASQKELDKALESMHIIKINSLTHFARLQVLLIIKVLTGFSSFVKNIIYY